VRHLQQVHTLKGITVTTATADQINESLKAIGDDIKRISARSPTWAR